MESIIRPVVPRKFLPKFIKSVCNPASLLMYQLYSWRRMNFKVHSMNDNSKDCLYMFPSSSFYCSQSKS